MELEVSCIVWVVRKIRHMIKAATVNLTPVAYTDDIATIHLTTSLSSASPGRMNLRLVRTSNPPKTRRAPIRRTCMTARQMPGLLPGLSGARLHMLAS
mgnify:CR=1 FL=1|jgi:hypothetical protein